MADKVLTPEEIQAHIKAMGARKRRKELQMPPTEDDELKHKILDILAMEAVTGVPHPNGDKYLK